MLKAWDLEGVAMRERRMNFEGILSPTAGRSEDATGKENTLPPPPAHSKVTKKCPCETQAPLPKR